MPKPFETTLPQTLSSSNKRKSGCHIHTSPMKQDNSEGGNKRNEEPIIKYEAKEENYKMPSLSIYHGDAKANEESFMKYEFNEEKNQMPSLTIHHGDVRWINQAYDLGIFMSSEPDASLLLFVVRRCDLRVFGAREVISSIGVVRIRSRPLAFVR
ncbi:hypothetical protein Sjap_016884 [Stephania japonica]|uniref:Uncharacterized protein n=1 Tax=Stephania japonica TaxID=461633 RepID=A0AAP0I542_9MAGN